LDNLKQIRILLWIPFANILRKMPYFPKEIRHPAARSLIFRMKSLPGKGVVIAEREEFAGEVGEEFGGNTELPEAIEKKCTDTPEKRNMSH